MGFRFIGRDEARRLLDNGARYETPMRINAHTRLLGITNKGARVVQMTTGAVGGPPCFCLEGYAADGSDVAPDKG